jgi:hypothetical protein
MTIHLLQFRSCAAKIGRVAATTIFALGAVLPFNSHAQAVPAQAAPVVSALCGIFANIPGASSQAQYQQFCGASSTPPAPAPGGPPGGTPSPAAICGMAHQEPSGAACQICAGAGSKDPLCAASGGAPAAPGPAALCTMAPQDPSGVACTICAGAGAACPSTGGTGGGGGGAPSQATVLKALCSLFANVPGIASEPSGQYASNCKASTTPAPSQSASSTSTNTNPITSSSGSTSSGALGLGLLGVLLGAAGLRSRSKKRRAL